MTKKIKCRVCSNEIISFMNFGEMPIANNLLSNLEDNVENEYKYEMEVAICTECACLQVINVPDKHLMFNNNYAYFASESNHMLKHFKILSEQIIDKYIERNTEYVLEIGSNDGIFLKNFSDKNIKHLGIDASSNLVQKAKSIGVNSKCEFFDEETAIKILKEYGQAKVIVITNTMHHIENCNSVAKGIEILLSNNGTLIIEDPYLIDMLEIGSVEQIYAEHNFIWCLSSYSYLFKQYNIILNDVKHFDTHGGSMRYFFSKNNYVKSEELKKYEYIEEKNKILDVKTYLNFKNRSEKICRDLFNFVSEKVKEGFTVCGYGATAKSSTTLNFSNIDKKLLKCIYDTTPFKIDKFTPGTHIKIRNANYLKKDDPDYTILFAWNHKSEILKKENKANTKWIVYIPELRILDES